MIGAFAGAIFFVVYAKDISAWARLGYFAASWIVGYYVAGEAIGREWGKNIGPGRLWWGIVLRRSGHQLAGVGAGGRRLVGSASIADRFGGRNG
ncbi:putative holin [Pseudomonas aeruginosa]